MKAHVFNERGDVKLRTVEVEPECGTHFCDSCGDCLACYGDDYCPDGGHHFVIYGEANVPVKELL